MEAVCTVRVVLAAATYAIDRPYDYLVPTELGDRVVPGVRVLVPFGRGNRRTEGIVLSVGGEKPQGKRLKLLTALLDDEPVLDDGALKLALWMRERYFCTVYEAARAMLPAGLWFSFKDTYRIADGVDGPASYAAAGRSESARRVLELIWDSGGSAEVEQLKGAFGTRDPGPALRQLTEAHILVLETSALRGVGDKTEQVASLSLTAEEAMTLVTPKQKSAPLRYAAVELLCSMGSASVKEICYYTGASGATLRSLAKSGIVTLEKREVLRRVTLPSQAGRRGPPELNEEQERGFRELDALSRSGKAAAALLYGVTGSGKTQVYIRLIESVLDQGRTAMVLVPEIALTPQLLNIFSAHFGDRIAVLHSSLRAGERYDEWKRVRSGDAAVVLGTRSAVFAPLRNLGLIVLDEEQEGSYKSENTPRYHARDVAKYRCAKSGGLLVLGSATPLIETRYLASTGVYHTVALTRRYNARPLPSVYITDMKDELKSGNGTSVSSTLRRELELNLRRGEQSILFLNRRGNSRMVSCGECGEVPSCPRCSVRLTYHSVNGRLMCHYCGHSEKLPETCPSCGGKLNFIGAGTQKIQEELSALFPGIEVLRMDADTISATQTHEAMLTRFEKRRVPILIGTQMVAKGLDFENVTLVGVMAADLALYVDSFRASERTFSLLTQVVGRAGRGEKAGRAVIQTYTPDNEVIRYAAAQDYESFYEQEIGMRRLMDLPPFQDIFILTSSGLDEGAVLRTCMRLRHGLESCFTAPPFAGLDYRLLGPAPAAVAKVNNRYRYRLTLVCRNRKEVRGLISHFICAAQADRENRGVSVFADMNPYE